MSLLLQRLQGRRPDTAIILGSSLGPVAEAVRDRIELPYHSLPGFPVPRVSGHAGKLVAGKLGGRDVAVLMGRAHPYETDRADAMEPVIIQLREAGISRLILTNAAGSLTASMRPGSIMMIDDHINLSGMNPLLGRTGDENFVPLTEAYDEKMRRGLLKAAVKAHVDLHRGVYVWLSGPSFETPAEIRMLQMIGGTAVGMSTVPETILARRHGLRVAGLSVITNLAAGIEGASPSHEETKREGEKAAHNMRLLLAEFFAGGS
jgi:purine-nucleoside phosphorylase